MKKTKIIVLFLLISVVVLGLASCKKADGGNDDTPAVIDDAVIYSPYVDTALILGEGVEARDVAILTTAYSEKTGKKISVSSSVSSSSHEIIIGKTPRELSEKAYNYLSRFKEADEVGYVIYSDGKSVAIAFDEAILGSTVCFDEAIEYFVANYMKASSLKLNAGAVRSDFFDAVERQAFKDEADLNKLWTLKLSQLEEKIGDKEKANAVLSELKGLHHILNDSYSIVKWLANLYDPVTGGFYYSNSARNSIGYAPDLESTSQALGLVESILTGYGGTLTDFFGEEIAERFVSFVKDMQEPDGYFYHPQWSPETVNTDRKNRDVLAALNILDSFGAIPIYDTPNGVKGEGTVTPASRLVLPLKDSKATSVSAVVSYESEEIYIPPHLTSSTEFYNYLTSLSILSETATVCETLYSEIPLYIEIDKILEENGEEYRLCDILENFLERHQNSAGLWASKGVSSYEEINELNSVIKLYNAIGKPISNYSAIFSTISRYIKFNEEIDNITDISGTWTAFASVVNNLKAYGDANEQYGINEQLKKIYLRYDTILKTTREKLLLFVNNDGSFSTTPEGGNGESFGMSVAVPMMDEGDMNGTILAAKNTWLAIFQVLDTGFVPIFDTSDRMMFQKTLLDMGVIIKNEIKKSEPQDFEGYSIGMSPVARHYGNSSGYFSTIVEGPSEYGNVAHIYSSDKSGSPQFYFDNMSRVNNPTCLVAEFDVSVLPETSTGIFSYLYIYRDTYMLAFKRDGDTISILERSSRSEESSFINDFGIRVNVGEWFNLRIEYYPGTHENVRIKIFFNNECIAVTDNYFESPPRKYDTPGVPNSNYDSMSIFAVNKKTVSILMDDLVVESNYQTYTPETSSSIKMNVDTPDKSQKVYDFEGTSDGSIPSGFESTGAASSVAVKTVEDNNKVLEFSGTGGKLALPLDQRGLGINSAVIEFDLTVSNDTKSGAKYQINFDEYLYLERSFAAMQLIVAEDGGKKYITIAEVSSGQAGEAYTNVRLSPGVKYRLRFQLFFEECALVVSIDGEVVGINTNVLDKCKKFYMGKTSIEALTPSITSTILIDNLVSERIKSSFEEATAPSIDRDIYDFDTSADMELSGISPYDGVLSFENAKGIESYVEIPVKTRVNVPTVGLIGVDVSKTEAVLGSLVVFLTDSSGNKIAAFEIVSNNSITDIYEYTENGRYNTPIHTVSSPNFNFSIEYGFTEESFNLLIDGEYVAASSLIYANGNSSFEFERLRISSIGGSACYVIDNLYAEQVADVFKPHSVSMTNTDATKEIIDYETSSFASMPENITFSKGAPDTYFRIGEGKIGDKVSKVMEFFAGYGDSSSAIVFNRTQTLANANAAFFETDIMFESTSDKMAQYNIYFRTENGNKSVYYFGIQINPDNSLVAIGNNGEDFKVTLGVTAGEWFKLRLEYADTPYDYDYDGAVDLIFRVYVNGVLICEGNTPIYAITEENPTLPSASSLYQMNTYIGSKREAKIYYDNTILGQFNMTYEKPMDPDTDTLTYEPGVITNKTQLTFGKNTSTAKISEMTVEGEVTKVLEFNSSAKSEDKIAVTPTLTLDTANAVSFETDIMIEPESDIATLYFEPMNKSGKQSFRLTINAAKDGDVTISSADIPKTVIGKCGEWIHLKVEYMNPRIDYTGDRILDILYKVYIGDGDGSELIATGYKPYNSGAYYNPTDIAKCQFTVTSETDADIFLDNTKFWQVERTADEAPKQETEEGGSFGGGGFNGNGWI